jgi:hypothetical protein
MILRVIIYLEILDFEVFGLKIPFLQVMDCHDSPGRAITRHGEQNKTEPRFCLPPTRHGEQLLASHTTPTRLGE